MLKSPDKLAIIHQEYETRSSFHSHLARLLANASLAPSWKKAVDRKYSFSRPQRQKKTKRTTFHFNFAEKKRYPSVPAKPSNIFVQHSVGKTCFTKIRHFLPTFRVTSECWIVHPQLCKQSSRERGNATN